MSPQKPSQEEERFIAKKEIERRKDHARDEQLAELHDAEVQGVMATLNITDAELGSDLVTMGFGSDTIGAFPLIPLVYVAWADGEVTRPERTRVMELAESRGLAPGTPSHAFLVDLLDRRPRTEFLDTAIVAIRRIYESRAGNANAAKTDLVSLCMSIAEASGGFMGMFGDKVNDEERELIKDIVSELGLDTNANTLLDKL